MATQGSAGTVVVFFANGTKQEFQDCKDIAEIEREGEKLIVFTQGKQRFVYKKSQLAGWSLPLTV